MRDTRRLDAGWTFIETIIVIAIVIIMTGTVAFSAVRYIDQARVASARSQITAYAIALQAYYIDCGRYPSEAQGIEALWEAPSLAPVSQRWSGPYLDRAVRPDPWGNAFEYRLPGPGGLAWEIVSYGSDGLPGGEGDDADISSAE